MIWHEVTWHDTIWYDLTLHDMIWYDMMHLIWHNVTWYDMNGYGQEVRWYDMLWLWFKASTAHTHKIIQDPWCHLLFTYYAYIHNYACMHLYTTMKYFLGDLHSYPSLCNPMLASLWLADKFKLSDFSQYHALLLWVLSVTGLFGNLGILTAWHAWTLSRWCRRFLYYAQWCFFRLMICTTFDLIQPGPRGSTWLNHEPSSLELVQSESPRRLALWSVVLRQPINLVSRPQLDWDG